MLWRERYTPFGESLFNDAAHADNIGFTGHIEDRTGLTYMQARYYDPVVGRFLSIDPVEFTGSDPSLFGRYLYVGNDPINKKDPFGLTPNQAGATDAGSVASNILYYGDLSDLAKNSSNTSRYFYAKTYGWIDVKHFATAAKYPPSCLNSIPSEGQTWSSYPKLRSA